MKLPGKKKKDERSIVSILLLGLIVLSISAAVCVYHVMDVRKCFEAEMTRQTYDEIQNLSDIMQETVGQNLQMLRQLSSVWQEVEDVSNEEGIYNFIDNYKELEDFDQIYYIAYDTGNVYSDGRILRSMSTKEMNASIKVQQPVIRMSDNGFGRNALNVIYYLVPIRRDRKPVGCLVGVHTTGYLLDSVVYGDARSNGDLFLINSAGKVYCQKPHIFDEVTKKEKELGEENFFERMSAHCADSYSKTAIQELRNGIAKADYHKTSFVDDFGMRDYIEVRRIDNVDDTYLIYLYPESLYTEAIQPVIFKSLMVSIIIICLTIGMLLYVWARSKNANNVIASLAYDDEITGGKNENYFREAAPGIIWENDSIPYVVVRFDIVNFRYINEAYGHVRADELLAIVGQEAAKAFNNKELCTRMTADQFLLLAKNDPGFELKFENFITMINERARYIGIKFPIRLKRGIYQVRKDDKDIGIVIDRANAARKSLSGEEKKLSVVYSDKIVGQMFVVDKIESEMESALKNGEFKVFIQAKWDIAHNQIYGGEALVRWVKEDGSIIYPDEFIPVFEKNGFVERLDMYMLEEVCKKLRELIDTNHTILPISVNQSRTLMHNPEYISQVAKILRRYRIPNGYIELEVTETVFLDDQLSMVSIMNKLKDMEVLLSMDDFGSGYSSLNMLKDIPFDIMKIDREFFSESATSNTSILILSKIIEMAEGLGIRVLCEGVETQEQVELLKRLGCHYVQGYYFSKPISAEEFFENHCKQVENGKEFYDGLFVREAIAREERLKIEAEAVKAQSASSAVERFKQTYVARPEEEKKEVRDSNEKLLSVEEQKAIAQMEREARMAKERVMKTARRQEEKQEEKEVLEALEAHGERTQAVKEQERLLEALKVAKEMRRQEERTVETEASAEETEISAEEMTARETEISAEEIAMSRLPEPAAAEIIAQEVEIPAEEIAAEITAQKIETPAEGIAAEITAQEIETPVEEIAVEITVQEIETPAEKIVEEITAQEIEIPAEEIAEETIAQAAEPPTEEPEKQEKPKKRGRPKKQDTASSEKQESRTSKKTNAGKKAAKTTSKTTGTENKKKKKTEKKSETELSEAAGENAE